MIGRLRSLLRGDGLGARAFRGSILTFAGFGAGMMLRLVSNLILTRILFPEAFGLMALVTVVITGLQMFSDTGIGTAILQNPRGDDPDFLNTAWTVEIGRGVLLWLALSAGTPWIAAFYDQPELALMLPVAGLGAVIQGFTATRVYTANRHLVLGRLTLLDLGSQLVGILVMVGLALVMQSVWALVLGGLVGTAVRTVLSHLVLRGVPNRLHWERETFLELFHFGKYIFVSSIAGFLINNGDRAILGKFVSLTELAVYNIAFFLASVPLLAARQLAAKVLLPLCSHLPADATPQNSLKLRKARTLLTFAMMGVSLFLALIGDVLVRLLYTEPYHMAGPILVLISLACLFPIANNPYGALLLGRGNSRDFTLLLIVTAAVQSVLLYFGVRDFGLMGAILAVPAATILAYPLTAWLARREGLWNPGLDALCLVTILLGSGLVLWLNDTAIARVLVMAAG